MEDSDASSIEACMRNEPVRDELMTLSGPIRAERHIPHPLAESPVCLREFRFPATPTQSGTALGQLSTQSPQAPGSISNLVTAHSWLYRENGESRRTTLSLRVNIKTCLASLLSSYLFRS